MRRREESLGFWLRYSPRTHDRRIKVGVVLGSWLRLPMLAPATLDLSAEVPIQEGPCTELSIQGPRVVDGLGFPDQYGCTSNSNVEKADSAPPDDDRALLCGDGFVGRGSPTRAGGQRPPPPAATTSSDSVSGLRPPSAGQRPAPHDSFVRQAENVEKSPAANLPGEAVVSEHLPNVNAVEFSWTDSAAVMSTPPIPAPGVRFRTLLKAAAETRARSATLLDCLPPATDGEAAILPQNLPVLVGTPRFTKLPHSRSSVDLGTLGDQESERLLHEAETVRGIAHGQGELLAVFLNVPVEMVSRMRFVEEEKQLLYTLMSKPDLMRTRVHDMLALRDRNSREIHLVPHRTRYRMAFLA